MRGAEDSNSGSQRRIKNDGTGGRSGGGRNLFLTFCVSEASVVVEGEDPNEIQRPFLARKSERYTKDTVHVAVHRSVHLFGGRTL